MKGYTPADDVDEAGDIPFANVSGDYPGDLIKKLDGFDGKLRRSNWGKWRRRARECFDMYAGNQWPDEALEQFDFDGRTAIAINKVMPMVNALAGAEVQNRQEVRFTPREAGDVKANELLGAAVQWNRDDQDFSDEESQAFIDMLICGFGATNTRMNYDEDPEGVAVEDRVDPLELWIDPAAKKRNFRDRRFLRWDQDYDLEDAKFEFPELFALGVYGANEDGEGPASNNEPGDAYDSAGDEFDEDADDEFSPPDGMVRVLEYQWFERERYYRAVDPTNGQMIDVTVEDWKRLRGAGIRLRGVALTRKVYWRAHRAGECAHAERLEEKEFTLKFMAARLKRNQRIPFGIVEPMIDPQRWFNKFLVQLDRIIASNAKGGIMANSGAVDDPEDFEERWAKDDSVHWFADGVDLNTAVKPKPVPGYPQGVDRLLQFSGGVMPEVAGVNKETLGQQDRDQAGILEFERKKASFGVNADLFDALKAFRKDQGRFHLKLVLKYMSDGRLIRIGGGEKERYAPLLPQVRDPETARFDIVVDEAPSSPNQRERVAQTLIQLGPFIEKLMKMGLPPPVMIEVLESLPIPSSLVEKLRAHANKPPDQQQQMLKQLAQQLQMQTAQAELAKLQGEAAKANAGAQVAGADVRLKNAQAQNASLDARMKARIAAAADASFAPRGPVGVFQ